MELYRTIVKLVKALMFYKAQHVFVKVVNTWIVMRSANHAILNARHVLLQQQTVLPAQILDNWIQGIANVKMEQLNSTEFARIVIQLVLIVQEILSTTV